MLLLLLACQAPKSDVGVENPCGLSPDGGSADGGVADGGVGDGGGPDGGSGADPEGPDLVIRGVALAGSSLHHGTIADVLVDGGRIVALGTKAEPLEDDASVLADGAVQVDGAGRWLAPAFIDSHVHLAYYPKGPELAAGGVAAAVDLAAPLSIFEAEAGDAVRGPLHLLASGPMVTAVDGYPTTSWGADGYGLECSTADEAAAAVARLAELGARVIKLPLASGPWLDEDARRAVVEAAHAAGLPVASHATSDEAARLAGEAGADLLAHMPTATLSEETLSLWADRAAVSTLHAFGGSAAQENLAALRARGATILYGTDLGNTRTVGIDGNELALLAAAGMSGAEILAAGTSAPAAFWGLEELGTLAPGKEASMLLLSADPTKDPQVLASPEAVWIAGVQP